MEHVAEILHDLINASLHALTPNRAGELHALADKVGGGATAAAEPEPESPATEVISGSYDRSDPADRKAEIAALEKELAELRALDEPANGAAGA